MDTILLTEFSSDFFRKAYHIVKSNASQGPINDKSPSGQAAVPKSLLDPMMTQLTDARMFHQGPLILTWINFISSMDT